MHGILGMIRSYEPFERHSSAKVKLRSCSPEIAPSFIVHDNGSRHSNIGATNHTICISGSHDIEAVVELFTGTSRLIGAAVGVVVAGGGGTGIGAMYRRFSSASDSLVAAIPAGSFHSPLGPGKPEKPTNSNVPLLCEIL